MGKIDLFAADIEGGDGSGFEASAVLFNSLFDVQSRGKKSRGATRRSF
jgi:hypothetical protein